MANVDFPRGFTPKYRISGGTISLLSGDLASTHDEIAKDDALERRSDGYIHRAQASSVTIIGVSAEYKAANTGGTIQFVPANDTVFEGQVDDSTVNAQTDLGQNYNIVATAPDSQGRSQMEIDGDSQNTTATLPVQILRVSPGSELGANVLVEFVFNQHVLSGGGIAGI